MPPFQGSIYLAQETIHQFAQVVWASNKFRAQALPCSCSISTAIQDATAVFDAEQAHRSPA